MPLRVLAVLLACLAPVPPANAAEVLPSPVVVTAPRAGGGKTPASRTIVPRELLDDQLARGITDVIGNDASTGENYAPLGYYETLSIRGFTLDNAGGYKRDGLTIANESSMPLENKERVEILKGVDGFASGLAAPGGVVNYVTKRPTDAPLRRLTLGLSERGTRYVHADIGGRLGAFGYRVNAAREDYRPYVKEATGRREFLGAALDWRPTPEALLQIDADWQKKSQLSVPGYQPLGGTALPVGVRPEKMLNDQPWSEPVVIETLDLGARFAYEDAADWRLEAAVNRNRVAAEDKAAFPYGCSSGPEYLAAFCAGGDYDLYDYRSSGEVREATHAQVLVSGRRDWGGVRHQASAGLSSFAREVFLGREVYDYVGTANIYDERPRAFFPSPSQPGPAHRTQDYGEHAAFVRDELALSSRWTLHAGLRGGVVSDKRYSKLDGAPVSRYRRAFLSPQLALAFSPRSNLTSYAAYSQGLELGGTAGVTTANAGSMLDPKVTRQVEVGVKRAAPEGLSASAALFHIWKPLEFVGPDNVFVQRGTARHSGLELAAEGRIAPGLSLLSGASLIQARQSGTGVAAFEGKAPVNVPWLRAHVTLDWGLPKVTGASLNGTWARVSRKYALRDDSLSVPGYDRFDLGCRYAMRLGPAALTWRLRVENVLDAVYWKDAGEYFGDAYLHLGAPRTLALAVQLAL